MKALHYLCTHTLRNPDSFMISPGILISLSWLLTFLWTSLPTNTSAPPENPTHETLSLNEALAEKYEHIPSLPALEMALNGFTKLEEDLGNPLLTVIDFSMPSTEKRLWVIDVEKQEVILNSLVAHGRNTGNLMAESFSNRAESYQSSLGFYKTAETYQGKHGYSLRLDGLEKGFNDQARPRAIVIHGAEYAREQFVRQVGRLGRSLGCPALPTELSEQIINLIKNGSLLFIYGNDPSYLTSTALGKG